MFIRCYLCFYPLDRLLYFLSIIDMYMPGLFGMVFKYFNDFVQNLRNSYSPRSRSRNNRNPQQLPQIIIIQSGPFTCQFIIHIQCHHYADIHINQLGRQIKITLKTRCIYHIQHQIRMMLSDIFPDINFFRRIFSN